MSENQKGSKLRPLIIAVSILLAAAAVFTVVFCAVKKAEKNKPEESETSYSYVSSSTSASSSDGGEAVAAPGDDSIPQAISTTNAADRKDGSALPEGAKSELIKGADATNRWEASSVISSVTVERVKVTLNVYEKGEKTDKTKDRYMYAAVVKTRPSRVNLLCAKEFAPKRISGMPAIVRGFESKTDEKVLFACSNEVCSRDDSNPNGNIYYNSENNLEGLVIKNGVIAQQGKPGDSLVMYKDGKWEYPVRMSLSNSEELIKLGVANTVSYTYPVIWDGKKYDNSESEITYDVFSDYVIAAPGSVSSDRTLIGKIDDNTYVFLISEGFSGGYLVDYMMNDLGAKYAYWGAGGYATGMYVDGYGVITSNNYIAHGDLFCVK